MSMSPTDLFEWLKKTSSAEFVERIDTEPGLLERRDIGGDGFGVLHRAAALGRGDLVRSIVGTRSRHRYAERRAR